MSARSSGKQIQNPVTILLQLCFLLLFIAFQVRIVHQRPFCIRSLTTKRLTQKCSYAQLLKRIPRCRVIQPSFFCSFLLQYNARACAAVFDSHSDQLLRTLHPNTSLSASNAHFLRLSQSTQLVPSSKFLAQTLFRGIIRCTKTSGFAFEKWFSSTTHWVHNFAHKFIKCCSFQMSSDGGSA